MELKQIIEKAEIVQLVVLPTAHKISSYWSAGVKNVAVPRNTVDTMSARESPIKN